MQRSLKEKYRPKRFDDPYLIRTPAIDYVIGMHPNYPHLLFSGPPGTGKTTLAKIIARELHGRDWKVMTLFLDGSDETSVEVVRGKIKDFAKSRTLNNTKRVIILDEAEYMSANAQNALRGMMERYIDNVIFILTCNNENKIIKPLKDDENGRCHHVRFELPTPEQVRKLAEVIAKAEGIDISDEVLNYLVKLTKGKIRYLLDIFEANLSQKRITVSNLRLPWDDVDLVFDLIRKGNMRLAADHALKITPTTLTTRLSEIIFNLDRINGQPIGRKKVQLLAVVAEHDYRIAVGADVSVQVINLIYSLGAVIHE